MHERFPGAAERLRARLADFIPAATKRERFARDREQQAQLVPEDFSDPAESGNGYFVRLDAALIPRANGRLYQNFRVRNVRLYLPGHRIREARYRREVDRRDGNLERAAIRAAVRDAKLQKLNRLVA